MTFAPANQDELESLAETTGTPLTVIGAVEEGQGVQITGENGEVVPISRLGYRHS